MKASYSFEMSGLIHTAMQGDMPEDQNTFQLFFIKILYVVFMPPPLHIWAIYSTQSIAATYISPP